MHHYWPLFSSYNITIKLAPKARGRKYAAEQSHHYCVLSYDGWALVECIAYWQENVEKHATITLKEVSGCQNLTNRMA